MFNESKKIERFKINFQLHTTQRIITYCKRSQEQPISFLIHRSSTL